MAEDIVELGLEAIGPIVKHHDTVDDPVPFNTLHPLTRKLPGLANSQEQGQRWN